MSSAVDQLFNEVAAQFIKMTNRRVSIKIEKKSLHLTGEDIFALFHVFAPIGGPVR